MARLFKRGSVFIAATLVLYISALTFLGRFPGHNPLIYRTSELYRMPGGRSWQQMHGYHPATAYDVIITGSSHAGRGYDPFVFAAHGADAYTLGSNGQTPLNTYWLAKTLLDSANTRLLIMDAFAFAFSLEGLESTLDMLRNQPNNAAVLGMVRSVRDPILLNPIALRLLAQPSGPLFTNQSYRGLGFVASTDSIKADALEPVPAPVLLPVQRQYFEATLSLCRERGIRVVICSHYARQNYRGAYHAGLAHYLDSVLAGTGVPYLDFTNASGIEDRNWFEDSNHLNATGARIFTEQLADTLEALGYLKRR
ncbi:MAG: hypothetical protein JST98_04235 [Bacteroidetes bacterium]|nr:hypothetical protein [Bacteroidota bacterium]